MHFSHCTSLRAVLLVHPVTSCDCFDSKTWAMSCTVPLFLDLDFAPPHWPHTSRLACATLLHLTANRPTPHPVHLPCNSRAWLLNSAKTSSPGDHVYTSQERQRSTDCMNSSIKSTRQRTLGQRLPAALGFKHPTPDQRQYQDFWLPFGLPCCAGQKTRVGAAEEQDQQFVLQLRFCLTSVQEACEHNSHSIDGHIRALSNPRMSSRCCASI